MTDPFEYDRLLDDAETGSLPLMEPLFCDAWIASSTVHKAIRRGDAETAERAILTLIRHRGNGVFRRLMVIAFEDIGIAAPDLLVSLTRLCTDARYRRQYGDTPTVARWMVRAMAAAPKERSSDYLICSAVHRPDWECHRETVGALSVRERIAVATDAEQPLALRATASWFASGLEAGTEKRIGGGDLIGLMTAYTDAGLPEATGLAIQAAAKATREPIVLMLPPLLQELGRGRSEPTSRSVPVPPTMFVDGVPTYALDKHTRAGRQAIVTFARENQNARSALERHVPEFRHRDAAYLAAFYTDAMPVTHRFEWDQVDELETLGRETDLLWAGIPIEGMTAILDAFRSNLDHLNAVRAGILGSSSDKGNAR
ncbi:MULTISPECIES: hypothetical protein [unclassified Aurantimonas]|uniref:hypothetical protein n=1 Tax=unclassified Aurantimonas TaxID=2638230 RepID=UPI002E1932EE|nr:MULTISPECIES: hypothetical protein [unclassified Aurantimonas]MEC5293817.1 hypothetical protein [Aurantimonas sp. C2-3-R2]MEC5414875.1 hypothetical protein [Aurantimonas sp. C2-4-R8]